MEKIKVKRYNNCLVATDKHGQEFIDNLKGNIEYSAKIYKERYHPFHKKYWAILKEIVNNSEYFDGENNPTMLLHNQIKYGINHVDTCEIIIEGEKYLQRFPKPTDFASMDNIEFERYYNNAMDWLVAQDYLNTEGII
jgi:hypothetical protein